ncbi:unnamed protein product [Closterium sp. NIES-64]|nr:unnamed protein product [Closterium sp. NIES-64]
MHPLLSPSPSPIPPSQSPPPLSPPPLHPYRQQHKLYSQSCHAPSPLSFPVPNPSLPISSPLSPPPLHPYRQQHKLYSQSCHAPSPLSFPVPNPSLPISSPLSPPPLHPYRQQHKLYSQSCHAPSPLSFPVPNPSLPISSPAVSPPSPPIPAAAQALQPIMPCTLSSLLPRPQSLPPNLLPRCLPPLSTHTGSSTSSARTYHPSPQHRQLYDPLPPSYHSQSAYPSLPMRLHPCNQQHELTTLVHSTDNRIAHSFSSLLAIPLILPPISPSSSPPIPPPSPPFPPIPAAARA